jgi:hypothetical protein
MTRLRRLLGRQDGISLVMAVGTLGVLSMTGATLIFYSSSNARNAEYSNRSTSAYGLAEAGINEMMAVLSKPENNALMPELLPETTTEHETGTVTWSGTLNQLTQTWTLTSTGRLANPTGPGAADVERTLTAKVPVTPTLTQPLNNPAWNYIYSTGTGQPCDMTIANNVDGSSRLYVEGNLCLSNNVEIDQTSLLVKGNLDLSNNAQVGSSSSMSTRVETYVGGNCRYGGGSWATPCSGIQDSRRIYSKKDGPNWVTGVTNSPFPVIAAPAADYDTWYANSIPGPTQDCTSANGARTGVPPVFDNDGVRNNSVATIFQLTPSSSYTCRVGPADNPTGELSWNASTKVLTVAGTIYIDGSAKVTNGSLNQYSGQATIYLSGTLLIEGKLCGGVDGSNCDFADWNPNTEMLTFVADGSGGQAGTGNGILVNNNSQFQGGLFATHNVEYSNNSRSDGPIVGHEIIFSNNVQNDSFPTISTVPAGMPGNPAVYAQPNPPQLYSG